MAAPTRSHRHINEGLTAASAALEPVPVSAGEARRKFKELQARKPGKYGAPGSNRWRRHPITPKPPA